MTAFGVCVVNFCKLNGGYQLGGFIGGATDATGNLKITNCYSTVDIDVSSPYIFSIGGFAGALGGLDAESIIRNCYSTGDIKIENGVDTTCSLKYMNVLRNIGL